MNHNEGNTNFLQGREQKQVVTIFPAIQIIIDQSPKEQSYSRAIHLDQNIINWLVILSIAAKLLSQRRNNKNIPISHESWINETLLPGRNCNKEKHKNKHTSNFSLWLSSSNISLAASSFRRFFRGKFFCSISKIKNVTFHSLSTNEWFFKKEWVEIILPHVLAAFYPSFWGLQLVGHWLPLFQTSHFPQMPIKNHKSCLQSFDYNTKPCNIMWERTYCFSSF